MGDTGFLRLPSGMVCAGNMFSTNVDKLIEGIPGVFFHLDDLKIQGEEEKGEEDTKHDIGLLEGCEVVKHHGLVFNLNKCIIKAPEVTYFGYILKMMVSRLTLTS